MKQSDSTNSLDELNPTNECFVCLEDGDNTPLIESSVLRTCGCRFHVHSDCWNQWMKGKTEFDCPICRKSSLIRVQVGISPLPSRFHTNQTLRVPWSRSSLFFILLILFIAAMCGLLVAMIISRKE